MMSWQLTVGIGIGILCVLYLTEIAKSYSRRPRIGMIEGFSSLPLDKRVDDACYDEFYAKVYDPLVQPTARAEVEIQTPIDWLATHGRTKGELRIADIGCGTGIHVEMMRREGVRSAVGYDRSPAMVAQAKKLFPESTYEVGDVTVATMAAADQFDLVTLYYFTLYMIQDRQAALKNIYLWLSPGGIFCVHIVNKLKFDPILESASPFVGFSIQKYADERVTKSAVTFDEFDYTGDFQLHGSRAIYEEEFRFKNGNVRTHEQRIWMPNIEPMVKEIEDVGFKLLHHVDLTAIGYEYQFLFLFSR